MQNPEDAGRPSALVLDIAAGTAILHGEEIELPFKEFTLLVALAKRVGETVPKDILMAAVWGEDAEYTPQANLYVLVRNLRKRLSSVDDFDGIRGRRNYGYVLDLAPSEVALIRSATSAALIDRPESEAEVPADIPAEEIHKEAEPADGAPIRVITALNGAESSHRSTRPMAHYAGAAVIAILLVTGSWGTGYVLAERRSSSESTDTGRARIAADPAPSPNTSAPEDPKGERRDRDERKDPSRKPHDRRPKKGKGRFSASPAIVPATSHAGTQSQEPPGPSGEPTKSAQKDSGSERAPSAPAAPTRYLYHLVHVETGDHFVTTDGNTASEYEAQGYRGGTIARVYISQEQGTKAITTNHGTAWIFVDRSARTEPASQVVPLWYSTNDAGDFFYTTSESEAGASGWSGSLVGYVRSL